LNEEIVVNIGGSTSGLATALRGVKGMMHKAGEEIKDSFKDAFKHLFAPLTIAGAVEGVRELFKGLMEDVKNIKRISESTGLSTGMVQDFLNLGKAAGIASDQIESAMDKFVKNLKPGDDPEEALMDIADRFAGLKDPVERSQLAFEEFGKSGAKLIPILMQGKDGVKKLAEEWGKLDEVQIAQMEHTNQVLEKGEQNRKLGAANAIETVEGGASQFSKMPWWLKASPLALLVALRRAKTDTDISGEQPDVVKTAAAKTPAEKNKDMVAAGVAAAKELSEKQEYYAAKPEEKVLMLTRQILALRREMEDSTDGQKRLDIESQIEDITTKREGIQKTIDQKAKETADKQKKAADDILRTQQQIAALEAGKANYGAQYASLQEVASSGFSYFRGNAWRWQQGANAGEAQNILSLQAQAKDARIWGNIDYAKQLESRANQLQQDLQGRDVIAPDEGLKGINDKLAEAREHLATLSGAVNGKAVKVIGPED
jgi:hypothetical protein